MSDKIQEKIESKLNSKLAKKDRSKSLDDGFKKNKVINEVLDKVTVFELYDLISSYNSKIVGLSKTSLTTLFFLNPSFNDLDLRFLDNSELIFDSSFSSILSDNKIN